MLCLHAFELFECSCGYLFTHRSLSHLLHVFPKDEGIPVCLCPCCLTRCCTEKMLSTQELTAGSHQDPLHHEPLGLQPLCGLILPSLCRGLAGSSMSTCSAKVFGLMQLSSVVGALNTSPRAKHPPPPLNTAILTLATLQQLKG